MFFFRVGSVGRHRISNVFSDITARKHTEDLLRQSEQRQSFLLRLSDALRPLDDPLAVLKVASQIVGEHLGVDRAYYVEIDDAHGLAHVPRD